jgi:hypothetical protein
MDLVSFGEQSSTEFQWKMPAFIESSFCARVQARLHPGLLDGHTSAFDHTSSSEDLPKRLQLLDPQNLGAPFSIFF